MTPQPPDVRALVLDLGGVVFDIDWMRTLHAMGLGGHPEALAEASKIPHSDDYDAYERGALTTDEFRLRMLERFGRFEVPALEEALHPDHFDAAWCALIHRPIEGVGEIIARAARAVPVYALSNTTEAHVRGRMAAHPVMAPVTRILTSYELRARKPESEIYARAEAVILDARDGGARAFPPPTRPPTLPDEILFIDDLTPNVEAARARGWRAERCVSSAARLDAILRDAGIY